VPIAPADIENQTFRIVFRGYDVLEVDAFLERIQKELARPAGDGPASGDGPPGSGAASARDGDSADPETALPARALRILRHAEQMADHMLAEAAVEAEQIRMQAQAEGEQIVAGARAESSRAEAENFLLRQREQRALVHRCEELRAEVDRLSGFERGVRESLRAWLSQHQELLERRSVVGEVSADDGHAVPVDRPALAS
jgi:DivIVA domain-containing protein